MQAYNSKRSIRGGGSIKPSWHYWMLYLIPGFFVYVFFLAWPLLDSVRLSFFSEVNNVSTFSGFDNYTMLFTDKVISERFWGAFGHTWVFFAIHMLVQNVLGMLFAVMLTNATMKAVKLYRTILFLPVTLSILVTGYLWKLLLSPVWAGKLLNDTFLQVLVQPWLGNESTALVTVALVSCWQWVGLPTMMFVAALQGIDDSLIEAASIEGSNDWDLFWKIKFPLIKPVAGIIAILTFVNNFNAFDVVFSMEGANGAPNYSTDIIGTFFYRIGIAGQHPVAIPNAGIGAAVATTIFIMLSVFVIPTLIKTQGDK